LREAILTISTEKNKSIPFTTLVEENYPGDFDALNKAFMQFIQNDTLNDIVL